MKRVKYPAKIVSKVQCISFTVFAESRGVSEMVADIYIYLIGPYLDGY